MIKRIFRFLLFLFFVAVIVAFVFLFVGKPQRNEQINWGVNFSQKQAKDFGFEWKEVYSRLLDDMNVKKIKLATYWDLLEPEEGKYDFKDLDWQLKEAEKKGANLLLVVGMKTPRWPECHIPQWAKDLPKEQLQEKVLNLLKKVILRYNKSASIAAWQVENEPFFPFGNCPFQDKNFLEREISLVKSLDQSKKPVVISDSGEGSFWFRTAKMADIVGTTLYRKVWFTPFEAIQEGAKVKKISFYLTYPFPAVFYQRKAWLVKKIFNKEVINVEIQAEPWGPGSTQDLSFEEQEKTMSLDKFKENIEFAKNTGLREFYLWGAEWMYWLKEKQNKPEIWDEAKKLFID